MGIAGAAVKEAVSTTVNRPHIVDDVAGEAPVQSFCAGDVPATYRLVPFRNAIVAAGTSSGDPVTAGGLCVISTCIIEVQKLAPPGQPLATPTPPHCRPQFIT